MADRYWNPAANANWGDANVWATIDGGDPTGIATPTTSDNVYFTSTNVSNCSVAAAAACHDINFQGGTGYSGTFSGASALTINGSMTLDSAMTRTFTGTILFNSTSTGETLTFDTKTLASVTTFNGAGGGWTIQDTASWGNAGQIIFTTGSLLDFNGQTITADVFAALGTSTRTITMGNSAATISSWACSGTNITFNCNGSTITWSGSRSFGGGTYTYNNVVCNCGANSIAPISGAFTCTNLTINGTSAFERRSGVSFAANVIITSTFTVSGNTTDSRLILKSSVLGTARTITAAVVALTNADFQDITAAGVAIPFTGTSMGDCLGNTNITCDTAAPQYWYKNTGSWSDSSKWFLGSGGTGGAGRVPLPQDDVIFDDLSFDTGSQTVTANMPRVGTNITTTNIDSSPTISVSISPTMYGSLSLGTMTLSSSGTAIVFEGRSSTHTITTAGATITAMGLNIQAFGGKYTFSDGWTNNGTQGIQLINGTLDLGDSNHSFGSMSKAGALACTLLAGTGTITLTATGNVWSTTGANFTYTKDAETIKFTNVSASDTTFSGGGKSYNNLWFARGTATGSITIAGNNTFVDFKDTGTVAHTIRFTVASTQHVTTFTVSGSNGNAISINSTTTGIHNLIKDGGGTISCDWLNIQHSVATPANTWYAGANSVNNQTDVTAGSGWIFTAPPSGTNTGRFFAMW